MQLALRRRLRNAWRAFLADPAGCVMVVHHNAFPYPDGPSGPSPLPVTRYDRIRFSDEEIIGFKRPRPVGGA